MILDTNVSTALPIASPVLSDPFSDDHNTVSPVETLPDYHASNANRRSQTLPDLRTNHRLPSTRPPSYTVPRPSQPQIYTFTPWTNDTVLLLPPASAATRSPLYHISVALNLNPFAPLSYITTVRRGGDDEGDKIGEFELGISHPLATVTLGTHSSRMSSVLTTIDGSPPPRTIWRWKHDRIDFRWDCRTELDDGSPLCICLDSKKLQLASLVPPPLDDPPPLPDATLTVFPDGHRFFDDILLSGLIIARKMTLSF